MTIELNISNLNDAVPFYNRLLGRRPERMDFTSVSYKFRGVNLQLVESKVATPIMQTVYLDQESELLEVYQRLRYDLNKGSMSTCEILSDTIQIQDTDRNTWIFTTNKGQTSQSPELGSKCYLEPFFN